MKIYSHHNIKQNELCIHNSELYMQCKLKWAALSAKWTAFTASHTDTESYLYVTYRVTANWWTI